MGNAAVNWVSHSGLSFIGHGGNGVAPGGRRDKAQELGDVAGAEDSVNCSKNRGAFVGGEIWCKNALRRTFSSEELARSAWRARPGCHH